VFPQVGFGGQPYILKGKLNLNSPDEQERAHAIEVLKGGIDQAYELGAGKFGFLSGPKPPAAQRDQALELLADSIVQLGRYARSKGDLALSLETFDDSTDKKAFIGTNRLACELAYEVRKAIPDFGLMVDLSHLPMQGETPRQALSATRDFINHAHIGNCVIGDPNHPDYGDLHPYFGHPEGENNVPQVREFLRCLLDIGYLRPDAPERNIVAFDLRGEQLIEAVRKMKTTSAKPAESQKGKADAAKAVANEVKEIPDKPLYEEYLALERQRDKQIAEDLAKLRSTKGEAYLNTADGKIDAESIRRAADIGWTAERFQFLLDHNTSPLMPLLVERDMLPIFNKEYGRQLSAAVAPQVLTHPYARSLENNVRSRNLMQGSDVPDIALPLANGTVRQLSNSLGKFVLLTFWASGCTTCQRDLLLLKKLYDETRGSKDKFEMIGFSLDKNPKDWKKAMKTLGIDAADWLQACDFKGSASPSVRLFNVGETPTNVLIDPEGKTISLTLQGDELVTRVKQILSGDLYYQKEEPKK